MKNVLYIDLNNSFKFYKLLDHFSLGTVKYSLGLGKVGTMKSHVEQYNIDADIQIVISFPVRLNNWFTHLYITQVT